MNIQKFLIKYAPSTFTSTATVKYKRLLCDVELHDGSIIKKDTVVKVIDDKKDWCTVMHHGIFMTIDSKKLI